MNGKKGLRNSEVTLRERHNAVDCGIDSTARCYAQFDLNERCP